MKKVKIQQSESIQMVFDCHQISEIVSIGVYVKTGSMNESENVMGASHFLEHLAFKGAFGQGPKALNQAFERLGARHNAYTTIDHTAYFAQTHQKHTESVLTLLIQMLFPAFTQEQFELEKEVILEELQMYEDQPESKLSEQLQSLFFGVDAYSILGNEKTITSMEKSELQRFHQKAYTPENVTIVISGNINSSACSNIINNTYQKLDQERQFVSQSADDSHYLRETHFKNSIKCSRQHQQQVNNQLHMSYLQAIMPSPYGTSNYRHTARLWAELISGDNSFLYKKLVECGAAEEVSTYCYSGAQFGYTHFYCTHPPANQVQENWLSMFHELVDGEKLAMQVTEDHLQRVIVRLISQTKQSLETSIGRMRHLGESWIENKPLDFESELISLNSLKLKELFEYTAEIPISQMQTATLAGNTEEPS